MLQKLLASLVLAIGLCACPVRVPDAVDVVTPEARAGMQTGLNLSIEPPDAKVFLDDAPIGSGAEIASRGGVVELKPGIYRLLVKRPGYQTVRAEVAVQSKIEALQIRMEKRL